MAVADAIDLGPKYEGSHSGDDVRWDDLRFPAQGIDLGGLSDPPNIQADTGLFLFDPIAVETIAILAQMPHAWLEESTIKPHVHWAKTSDAAGDVLWSLRYKWFNFGELQPAWSAPITATDVQAADSTQKHMISTFGNISARDKNISSLFLCQLGRLATDGGDDYAADALLYEFDIHYIVDGRGSLNEFSKTDWGK